MMIANREKLEVLTITMEECAEVIKECAKIQRYGIQGNKEKLETEIGDLGCMFDILAEYDIIDLDKVKEAAKNKREKLKKWSDLDV